MSSRFDLIAQQLFRKDFDHCTLDELERFTATHPYLAAAHYLLARRMADGNDMRYAEVVQTAALYHHQPAAFEAFLLAPEPLLLPNEPEAVEGAPPAVALSGTQQPETVLPVERPAGHTPVVAEPVAAEDATNLLLPHTQETAPPAIPALPAQHAPVASDALTFEPFHTVDYFASMGIRLSQDEVPKDKFGKQLMSFTAWLKTMKKLPAGEQARNMDPQAEARVESMAAHSVSSPEVVTETMAEIWIKQGQPAKAAEVYRKLSLLHPSKKAYFASKLENLKQ